MLKKRIQTALVLIILVFLSITMIPNNYFSMALIAITCIAIWEYGNIIQIKNLALKIAYTAFVCFIAIFLFAFPESLKIIVSIASLWWLLNIIWIKSYPNKIKAWNGNWFLKIINGVFIFVPAILSLSFIQKENPKIALLCLILVWCADSGGLIVGNKFGKHNFIPKASPNKTLEGVFGSFLFCIISAIIYVSFVDDISLENYIVFSLTAILVAFYAIIGDLFESLYKRVAKIKDSGNLLPGHGGLFDRIDGLVAALPIFCLIYINFIR